MFCLFSVKIRTIYVTNDKGFVEFVGLWREKEKEKETERERKRERERERESTFSTFSTFRQLSCNLPKYPKTRLNRDFYFLF